MCREAVPVDAFGNWSNNRLPREVTYRVMFASGDWTCTIARWKGKMIGPWTGLDGKVHEATGKTFDLEFCTVARWQNGEIVEENLFYDQVGFLRQIGVL